MNRSALTLLCFAASFATAAQSNQQKGQTPQLMLARIRNEGPAAVIHALWDSRAQWDDLMDKVATGDPAWVDVAVALGSGSDAGSTSELKQALFEALEQNAEYVLRVLPMEESDSNPLAISEICQGRDDPLSTYDAAIAEQKRAEAAVEKVDTKAIELKRQRCLADLRSGEADLRRYFAVPGSQ